MPMKPVKTDSPEEPKSSVYAQNRCVARQLGRTLPSTFSFQPSQLPALTALPSGLGGTAALQEPSPLGCFLPTEKTGSLSRWQASDHCEEHRACQLVLFITLTRESESQGHASDFPGFMDLDSPQACNTFLVLVFSVSWHLQCGKP